jgi:hypothetical protein
MVKTLTFLICAEAISGATMMKEFISASRKMSCVLPAMIFIRAACVGGGIWVEGVLIGAAVMRVYQAELRIYSTLG